MMGIDLSRFKVVYGEKVLKAVSLQDIIFDENTVWNAARKKPRFIEILVINEDGNIEVLRDEAWMFQFVPVLNN